VKQVRKILTSLMIIAVLAALITAGAMAVFTDQETNPDNVFTQAQ
jgi:predicted ribosomally synthesized peptide with SipW-like signal peptide